MIPAEVLRECLRAAAAAPSVHNTQPWRFRVRGDTVDVLADRHRQLRTLDPDGRELFLSVGAAVFNLRVALRARQYGDRPRQPDHDPRHRHAHAADARGGTARRSGANVPPPKAVRH